MALGTWSNPVGELGGGLPSTGDPSTWPGPSYEGPSSYYGGSDSSLYGWGSTSPGGYSWNPTTGSSFTLAGQNPGLGGLGGLFTSLLGGQGGEGGQGQQGGIGGILGNVLEGVGGVIADRAEGALGELTGDTPMSYEEGRRKAQIDEAVGRLEGLIEDYTGRTVAARQEGDERVRGISNLAQEGPIADYIDEAGRSFRDRMTDERNRGVDFLTDYEPGIKGTKTERDFTSTLRGAVTDYMGDMAGIGDRGRGGFAGIGERGIGGFAGIGEKGRDRYSHAATTVPIGSFELINRMPSFNLLRNNDFMDLAKNPPTVKGDLNRFAQTWSYNV